MQKKSIFIVEDNIHQLAEIREYVASHPMLVLSGWSRNGLEAVDIISKNPADLLLVDINLPGCSGIELIENLENPPYCVFITSYDDYAIKAFELGAIDYILKPVTSERLNISINRFLSLTDKKSIKESLSELGLSFRNRRSNYYVGYDQISYITACDKNTIVHTTDMDFEASCLLKVFENKLPPERFLRVHRKYIVNISYLSYIKSKHNTMFLFLRDDDDTPIPVSKSYQSNVKNLLLRDQKG